MIGPDGASFVIRYRPSALRAERVSVELFRGGAGTRRLRNIVIADDLLWMFPKKASGIFTFVDRCRRIVSDPMCALAADVKSKWLVALSEFGLLIPKLVARYLSGNPDTHKECISIGAVLKYFLYCMWMKAVVNGNPSLLFKRFRYWEKRLLYSLLHKKSKGQRGWGM